MIRFISSAGITIRKKVSFKCKMSVLFQVRVLTKPRHARDVKIKLIVSCT